MNDSNQRTTNPNPVEARDAIPAPAVVQFLRLLWRRKLLIAVGSLLPALVAALVLYLWPQDYRTTFVYEHPLKESEYNVLARRFYSMENLDRIAGELRARGLTHCAEDLLGCRTEKSLEKIIRFIASPAYPARLQTTDPATSEKISAFPAQLLSIRITAPSRDEVKGLAGVVTTNFEHVLPLYDIRVDLKELIRKLETTAADIEDNRFTLATNLKEEQARFEKLKALEGRSDEPNGPGPAETSQDKLTLQLSDVDRSREFLPMPYQIRAVQSKIIDLQETINSNESRYAYCIGVLGITRRLLDQVEQSILKQSTAQQFLAFVAEQLQACKDTAQADYLKAYIRKTENLILASTRAGESPAIYPVPKHLVARSALAFVAFLMVMVFAAVVAEAQHSQNGRGTGRAARPDATNSGQGTVD
jgi:hypothetical protein